MANQDRRRSSWIGVACLTAALAIGGGALWVGGEQMPSHTGPPLTAKPPALHPSLRLPYEKRPVLAFEQLSFVSPQLLAASISQRPPTAAVKQAMLDKVEAILAEKESNVLEHFGEMHAAVQQALPLGKVLDQLPLL